MDKSNFINNFGFSPSTNQLAEIDLLINEIARREKSSTDDIIRQLQESVEDYPKNGQQLFFHIKKYLIRRRFPLASAKRDIEAKNIFLPRLPAKNITVNHPKAEFVPEKIFIEKSVGGSKIAKNFHHRFPDTPLEIIDTVSEYTKTHKYTLDDFKKPILFITRQKWDFIKPCPCTQGHVRCGYWILNLGFGCPYDCSYCYLQQYANFPGIIIPANLEDFFSAFDEINKDLTHIIRIGTGEFTDSLALDHITEYSKNLIPYFADKKVIFELKTKSANIENLLTIPAPKNIVIAWSLNTQDICSKEELATATIEERLTAAEKCQTHGYKVAFHFDPVIIADSWKEDYKKTIDKIYSFVKPPFAWISLGTLRCQRDLKSIVKQRFPESNIFNGELLLGADKKLRYPEFMREDVYQEMMQMIHIYDDATPVYLCMETPQMWQKTNAQKP